MKVQLKRAWYITRKDMRTYYMKPPLISWGIILPLVMILAFYIRNPGDIRSVVPGLIGMTVLFGATSLEAVVITFEKRIGAMERLLMAPIAPFTLVLSKMVSGALFGLASGCLVWLLGSAAWGLRFAWLGAFVTILLGSITFSLLGVVISLLMREVFDAMTMSNYFRFPMVFLCGVFVPLSRLPAVLRIVASFLPLTYMVDALRYLLIAKGEAYYPLTLNLGASALFASVLYWAALKLTRHRLEDLIQ
ncbi:MAG: ABC transporter permease [Chloroflexota bacterium]|nr:ABC transporter permease [Chloroflexota bacterium]